MIKKLIDKAFEARDNSYSPYSKFKVGSSVLTDTGKIYTGCNIENAAYTPTVCAERVAIFKAISNGEKNIKKIVIVGSNKNYTYPCGVCRQVLREFLDENSQIIVAKSNSDYKIYSLEDLLPNSFGPDDLGR